MVSTGLRHHAHDLQVVIKRYIHVGRDAPTGEWFPAYLF
jgi:hypothetical protein